MREQCALARRLPSQRRAKAAGIDRDQHQAGRPGKVLGRGLLDLAGAGEMDVAVALVDGGAVELAGGLSVSPDGRIADLIDDVRHAPDLGIASCAAPEPRRTRLPSTPQRRRASPSTTSIRGFVHSPIPPWDDLS